MTKEEQFLSLYKDFERLLQDSAQMSILDYENAIKDKDGELSEKIKLCRIMRNYMQHHSDYKSFVTISAGQISLIEKLLTTLRNKDKKAKDIMKKWDFPNETTYTKDVGVFIAKKKLTLCPIVDSKKHLSKVVSYSDVLLGMVLGTPKSKIHTVKSSVKNSEYAIVHVDDLAKNLDLSVINIVVDKDDVLKGIICDSATHG